MTEENNEDTSRREKKSSGALTINIGAPPTCNMDVHSLDKLLTRLKELAIDKSFVLVVDCENGLMILFSQISLLSPWLEVPPFCEQICFERNGKNHRPETDTRV